MTSDTLSVSLPVRFLSAGYGVPPDGRWLSGAAADSVLLVIRDGGSAGKGTGLPATGEAIFVPADSPRPEGCGPADAGCRYWLRFRSDGRPDSDRIGFDLLPIPLTEDALNRLSYSLCQLLRESENLQGTSDLCDYMLSTFLLLLRDNSFRVSRTAAAARMLDYIRSHCYEPLTMPDVARALGYSEDYLSRLLHEEVSCSFRRYIHSLRMQRAKRELLAGGRSIREIAEDCGYSNPKFFSTAFLKCEGITPSAYRNLYVPGACRERV